MNLQNSRDPSDPSSLISDGCTAEDLTTLDRWICFEISYLTGKIKSCEEAERTIESEMTSVTELIWSGCDFEALLVV